jgi:hypothetical protein
MKLISQGIIEMNIIKNQALSIVLALSTILAMQGCATIPPGEGVDQLNGQSIRHLAVT